MPSDDCRTAHVNKPCHTISTVASLIPKRVFLLCRVMPVENSASRGPWQLPQLCIHQLRQVRLVAARLSACSAYDAVSWTRLKLSLINLSLD